MAHWIKCSHLFRASEYECSNCGNKSDKPYTECPHCGSEMTSYQSYHSYDPSWIDEMADYDEMFGDDDD